MGDIITPAGQLPELWKAEGDSSFSRGVHMRGEPDATVVNTTKTATGDNEIVASPGAAAQIVVLSFAIQNESSTATTMILRSGSTTNGWRYLAQNQGDDLSKDFALARPWKLNADEALNLNLDGANSCGVSVMYYTE